MLLLGCTPSKKEVDLILYNGYFHTLDSLNPLAQAVAVDQGVIVAVGSKDAVFNRYRAKEIHDLKGAHVYPGFIDAHAHFVGFALQLREVSLYGCRSIAAVLERLKEWHKKHPKAKWIIGRGWDHTLWNPPKLPHRKTLDSLFPNIPVFLVRVDGHAAWVNSKALRTAGITSETTIQGGRLIKDAQGALTGVLIDNAIELVRKHIPPPTKEELAQALIEAQDSLFAEGLTTVCDAGLDLATILLIDSLQRQGKLRLRIYAMANPTEENFRYFEQHGPITKPYLHVCSFKFYADGALGSRGAWLKEPYSDEPHHRGLALLDSATFLAQLKRCYQIGFQANTHAIGDAALCFVLRCYAKVLPEYNDARWRIEHAQVLAPECLPLFKKYNVIASVQPCHAISDRRWAQKRLGTQRLKNAYAYRTLLQWSPYLALGTDFPVEPPSPLRNFFAAVFRSDYETIEDEPFFYEERLTPHQALLGMTLWSAKAQKEEHKKGRIAVGNYADFTVLSVDLLKAPKEAVRNAKVIATYVNGVRVYSIE